MNLIQTLEQDEITRLGRKIPDFGLGDTVIVKVNVGEGDKKCETKEAHDHCAGCASERPLALAPTAAPKRRRRSASDSTPPSAIAAPPN